MFVLIHFIKACPKLSGTKCMVTVESPGRDQVKCILLVTHFELMQVNFT